MDKRKIDALLKIYDGVYRGTSLFNIIFFFLVIQHDIQLCCETWFKAYEKLSE